MKIGGGDANKKIAKKSQNPKTIFDLIKTMQPQIKAALPKHMDAERVTRIAMTAVRQNPKLGQCDSHSLLAALMTSAQLGLEPNTPLGQAYLIPYKIRGNMQAVFQVGYKGILDLAYRSGKYSQIYAMEVYADDYFEYEYGLNPNLVHKPADTQTGEPVYYYAVLIAKDGGRDFRVWSTDKVREHAKKYSKAWNDKSSAWQSDFNSMAKKTVLLDTLKYAQKSVEVESVIGTAMQRDERISNASFNKDEITIDTDFSVVDEPAKENQPVNTGEGKVQQEEEPGQIPMF